MPDSLISPKLTDEQKRARKREIDRERSAFGMCQLCGQVLATHPKCEICFVLLHPPDDRYICNCGVQHWPQATDRRCEGCLGMRKRKR